MNTISSPLRTLLVAAAITSALWAASASAQLPNLFELTGQYTPSTRVPGMPGLEARVVTCDAALSVPIVLSKQTFLVPGLAFHSDAVSHPRSPEGFVPIRALYASEASFLLVHLLTDNWSLSFRGSGTVAGDLETLDSDAFQWGGVAMGTYVFGEHLVVGGGAVVTAAFGKLQPWPLAYVDWRPRRELRLEATLPYKVVFTIGLGDRFEVGAQADVSGYEYALSNPALRATCEATGEPCVDHVATSAVAATAFGGVRVHSDLWLTAHVGHTLFRRFEEKDASNRTLPGGKVDLPEVPVFRAGLVWRMPEH